MSAGVGQGVLETIHEQSAVWQTGERIVKRAVSERISQSLVLGSVAEIDDYPLDIRIVEQVDANRFERAPGIIGATHPEFYGFRDAPWFGMLSNKTILHPLGLFRVQVPGNISADDLLGSVAKYPLNRRTNVAYGKVGLENYRNTWSVLDEATKLLFAFPRRFVPPLMLSRSLS